MLVGFSNSFSFSFFNEGSFEECLAKDKNNITNNMQFDISEKNCRLKYPKLPSVINNSGKYVICKTNSWGPFKIKISKKNKNATFYGDEKNKYPLIYFTESELLIDMSSNPFSQKNYPIRYKIDYIYGTFNWIELGKTNITGICEEEIN
jgi:hypothetical protein